MENSRALGMLKGSTGCRVPSGLIGVVRGFQAFGDSGFEFVWGGWAYYRVVESKSLDIGVGEERALGFSDRLRHQTVTSMVWDPGLGSIVLA